MVILCMVIFPLLFFSLFTQPFRKKMIKSCSPKISHDGHRHCHGRSSSSSSSSKFLQKQPFFIMDWLDELISENDIDVQQIATLLQTPNKERLSSSRPSTPSPSPPPDGKNFLYNSSSCVTPKSSNKKSTPNKSLSQEKEEEEEEEARDEEEEEGLVPKALFTDRITTVTNSSSKKATPTELITLANAWNTKGLKKAQSGLWKDALSCWEELLDIREEMAVLDPTNATAQRDLSNALNNRGVALGKLNLYSKACDSLQRAIHIQQTLQSKQQVPNTLHNLANVHHQEGNLKLALDCLLEAKAKSNSNDQKARVSIAMGHVYFDARLWIDARDAYQDACNYRSVDSSWEVEQLQQDIHDLNQRIASLNNI